MTDEQYVREARAKWNALLDKFNDGKVSEIGVALWASLHVDRLLDIATIAAAIRSGDKADG